MDHLWSGSKFCLLHAGMASWPGVLVGRLTDDPPSHRDNSNDWLSLFHLFLCWNSILTKSLLCYRLSPMSNSAAGCGEASAVDFMSNFKETRARPDKSTNEHVQMYRHDLPVGQDVNRAERRCALHRSRRVRSLSRESACDFRDTGEGKMQILSPSSLWHDILGEMSVCVWACGGDGEKRDSRREMAQIC